MAKIILGGLVSDIGGSVGGSTFSKYRNGHILKTKAKQPKSNSVWRKGVLSRSAQVAYLWRNLSNAVRNDWHQYSILRGQVKGTRFPKLQTGYDLFRAINFFYVSYAPSGFINPIPFSYDIEPIEVTTVEGSPNFRVNFDRVLISADEILILKMTNAILPSRRFSDVNLKLLRVGTSSLSYFQYESATILRFGSSPQSGDTVDIAVSVMSIASGFMYPLIVQRFEIV